MIRNSEILLGFFFLLAACGSNESPETSRSATEPTQCLLKTWEEEYRSDHPGSIGDRPEHFIYESRETAIKDLREGSWIREYKLETGTHYKLMVRFNQKADHIDQLKECDYVGYGEERIPKIVAPISINTVSYEHHLPHSVKVYISNVIWGCYGSCELITKGHYTFPN